MDNIIWIILQPSRPHIYTTVNPSPRATTIVVHPLYPFLLLRNVVLARTIY
jgi:hypothetical protein